MENGMSIPKYDISKTLFTILSFNPYFDRDITRVTKIELLSTKNDLKKTDEISLAPNASKNEEAMVSICIQ